MRQLATIPWGWFFIGPNGSHNLGQIEDLFQVVVDGMPEMDGRLNVIVGPTVGHGLPTEALG